jgi:Secretion system C-terminal sorting domain
MIDRGVEDIHFGQIQLENRNDTGNVCTWNLYSRIRQYGALKNRGLVLINGDTYGLFVRNTDSLVYDYQTAPSRVSGYYTGTDSTWTSMWNFGQSAIGGPGRLGYTECSPYGKMAGGMTPMGWHTDTIPYQVALDNTLTNLCNCVAAAGCWSAYGYDEISWFVLQSESYRNKWLCYARNEVKALDRNCNFVMPVRTLFTRHWWYYVALNGYGFNQEAAIVENLNGVATDCNPNDVLDLHALYFSGQKDPTGVIVYPNPSSGEVTIVYHGTNKGKVSVKIADMLGREVAAWETGASQGNIIWNPATLGSGVYNCIVSTPDGSSAVAKITLVR